MADPTLSTSAPSQDPAVPTSRPPISPPPISPPPVSTPVPSTARAMTLGEWGLIGLLSLLWGGSFFFAKVAVAELPPFTLVFARVSLAAITLYAVLRIGGRRMPADRGLWLAFLGMGALNNLIPFSLLFYGQTQVASGLASILNATTPLWGVLLAHGLTRDERLTPRRLAGTAAGFAGVVVMIGTEALAGLGTAVLAQLAVVGAALSYGFAGIFGKRFRGQPPMVTATGQLTASSLLTLPVMLAADAPWALAAPGLPVVAAVIALATVSTALAYVIYFRVLATAGATNILLVTFLVPVSAIALGILVLGEALTVAQVAGFALIGLGLALIDGRPLAWLRGRRGG